MNCNFLFVYILDIDGGYTEWTEWTECTATCGGGTKRRSRNCTNPSPKNKGKTCIEQEQLGPPEESKECNTDECRKGRTIFSFVKFYERMTQFLPFPQSRFQSLRYPCLDKGNEGSGNAEYQPLFRKRARGSRPNSRDRRKSNLITLLFFKCTLRDTLKAKNSDFSSSTPKARFKRRAQVVPN